MGGAQHTGKLVLDIPRTGSSSVVVPPEQARVFRGDGAYIITGGLGGLGLFLAEKMAAAGCGRIVLTSRSQPNAQGAGDDPAHPSDRCRHRRRVRRHRRSPALRSGWWPAATATGLPLRGVLHAAAVVEDATLDQHHRRAHRP